MLGKRRDRATVVGITGIDCCGKTQFSKAFGRFLKSERWKVQHIRLDDFHNPKRIRHAEYEGESGADRYFRRSFDIAKVVDRLLLPIHEHVGRPFLVRVPLFDLGRDAAGETRAFEFDRETMVLFEGVFLFREEFRQFIDYKVFLDISFAEGKERAVARDGGEAWSKYRAKYYPAQSKYLRDYPPGETADMVIDNSDWERPRIAWARDG